MPAPPTKEARLDLAALAARRAEGYVDYFEGKGLALERELESITVAGEAGRLEQIVDNLLSDALRSTRPGGTVRLRLRREGRSALLEVSGTGIDITADYPGRVFDRLWRRERSRTRPTRREGTGLAVLEELVRAHEGSIAVESTPGQGSCVQVRLPARGQVPIPSLR